MRIDARHLDWAPRGKTLLSDVTLDAAPGSTVGLLGPNGSGKSSLLRVLGGLQQPDRGQVTLDGTDRSRIPRRLLARRVAMVTQHAPSDVDMTVLDVLLLGRIPHRPLLAAVSADDLERAGRALAGAGLAGFGARRWSTLSGGERQRADIARALLQEPDVLLLDEPTNHLDIRHQLDLLDDLSSAPATVVIALHDLGLAARYCDQIVLLHGGRVVAAGPPPEVLTPARIEQVFEVAADVTADGDGRWHVRLRRAGSNEARTRD
ncbi:histidinol phosphatase [Actinoplanes sp. ATCC 53533]|uniref:ABC transporter ATP-binding protein n=1 Tax=Actinoplanes sp. ATCC 53533 TaxID=1288362 RepID=UPI000F7A9EF8|nr:ABC transporter ATP-binding protein [Actinoplanes sp. ATCC 53533]RSM64299.1 histidinol phosphatase [Actinoplanes sp. ATCC 53533]